jgi:hypothetical protein
VDEMTPFWTKHVISFKRKRRQKRVKVQIIHQFVICSIKSSIVFLILKINSIASLPNSIAGSEVDRLFQIGTWSLIYAI